MSQQENSDYQQKIQSLLPDQNTSTKISDQRRNLTPNTENSQRALLKQINGHDPDVQPTALLKHSFAFVSPQSSIGTIVEAFKFTKIQCWEHKIARPMETEWKVQLKFTAHCLQKPYM